MEDSYWEQMKSPIADMKNTGGRMGGAITAALFLEKYVDTEKVPVLTLGYISCCLAGVSSQFSFNDQSLGQDTCRAIKVWVLQTSRRKAPPGVMDFAVAAVLFLRESVATRIYCIPLPGIGLCACNPCTAIIIYMPCTEGEEGIPGSGVTMLMSCSSTPLIV